MKSVNLGDDGLEILAPAFHVVSVQLLAFESCQLTDTSCRYIADIIKVYDVC